MEMNVDKKYLDKCLKLAELARAEGESPVGSLVVINDEVVGEFCYNQFMF